MFQPEPIFTALATLLEGIEGLTVFPELLDYEQVQESPALCIQTGDMTPTNERHMPTRWNLRPVLWISVRPDPSAPDKTAQTLRALVAQVVNRLAHGPQDLNQTGTTLGGLVSHCWVGGPVKTYEGIPPAGHALAIIPLDILTTA